MKRLSLILLAAALLPSCKDDPVFPLTPEIEFVSLSASEAKQFEQEVQVTIHYQDGDGDLGNVDSEDATHNIFITDTRPAMPDSLRTLGYSIPNLTPSTRRPSIQGTITVTLQAPPHYSWFDPNATGDDFVEFEIYIVDRAGHVSNTVRSTPLKILP